MIGPGSGRGVFRAADRQCRLVIVVIALQSLKRTNIFNACSIKGGRLKDKINGRHSINVQFIGEHLKQITIVFL